jgi:hypothetical protein
VVFITLYCVRVIIVRSTGGQNLKVLYKINIDIDTHNHQKSYYTNQEMSASHQEIEIIAA